MAKGTPGEVSAPWLGATGNGSLIVEAHWVAEFVAVLEVSTGKFAGVTGSRNVYAQSELFVLGSNDPLSCSWKGEGSLTFQKGR
jgi:hypothetical protein